MGICGIIRSERNILKVHQHKVVILSFWTVEFNPYILATAAHYSQVTESFELLAPALSSLNFCLCSIIGDFSWQAKCLQCATISTKRIKTFLKFQAPIPVNMPIRTIALILRPRTYTDTGQHFQGLLPHRKFQSESGWGNTTDPGTRGQV
jgi:hypothetical protein